MPDCFEILHKDLAGRIGRLQTPHGAVETPALMPVINPHLRIIEPKELKELGAEILITNSYIINQDASLKELALFRGLHDIIGFDGPIMTDSGAFQLSVYGDINVSPLDILLFQQAISSDICVPLDIPTPPDVSLRRAEDELMETERRLIEARSHDISPLLMAGPVQGSTYPHLREQAARRLRDLLFDVYPIGGVVPLMEAYRFRELIDVIAAAKRALGPGVPVHLFGAGHPMIFALAAALGCDLFDSAAYALYARDGRYITSGGTWRLEEMRYLPCNCDVCRNHSAEELQKSPDRQTLLARHNIGASFAEMRLVRQHIIEGSLWELIERRCASHPRMIEALRALAKGCRELETLDRATKSTFFYLGPASASRPEVIRYQSRIGRLSLAGRVLVTDGRKPEEWAGFDHVLAWKPPFGPYPRELSEVYPFNAEVPDEPDQEAVKSAMNNLRLLMQANPTASFELRLRSPAVSGPIDVAEDKGSEGLDLMTRRGA